MYTHPEQPAPRTVPPAPVTPTGGSKSSEQKESLRSILSTVAILLLAPLIAVVLTAFVFQSYQVDGPSMNDTLHNNDRLIVWKLPKTWAKFTHHDYIPKRGDIIVFNEPRLAQCGQDPNKQLIKRVIGLPGDRVNVKENKVMVYNTEHPDGFRPDTTLPYQHTAEDTAGNQEVTVGDGEVFVLGDNRPNSLDSRCFGMVESHDIVGKLVLRLLPIGDMKRF